MVMDDDVCDDRFLERVEHLLCVLARDCTHAEEGVEGDQTVRKTTRVLDNLQRVCREAGLVPVTPVPAGRLPPSDHFADSHQRGASSPMHERRSISESPRSASEAGYDDRSEVVSERDATEDHIESMHEGERRHDQDDIIEVEITDILTSTEETIQRWQHAFRLEMMSQEENQHEQNRQHLDRIHALQDALNESNRHISKLQRDLQDTTTKFEAFQALTLKAQKAMEVTLREHSQYWKAICNDLVVEKRNMARRLSEERGKYHALKEHMEMHVPATSLEPSADNRQDVRPRASSSQKSSVEDRPPSPLTPPLSSQPTKTHPTPSENTSKHIDSSMPPDPPSFRRYYLTKKSAGLIKPRSVS